MAADLSRWLSSFAHAMLAGDAAAGAVLVDEQFPAGLGPGSRIREPFRLAVLAMRDGRAEDAFASLTSEFGEIGLRLQAAANDSAVGDTSLREAVSHGVRGLWLEDGGWTAAAALAYFEAGKRFSWETETYRRLGIDLLVRARSLNPAHALTCWQLAEAWCVSSFLPKAPFVDRDCVSQGLEAWNAGAALQAVDAATSWTLLTRALLNEQLGRLESDRRVSLLWQGIWYLERALLLDRKESHRWALLARFHRMLSNQACAVFAAGVAGSLNSEDPAALEEQAAILADIGAFDTAMAAIARRLKNDPDNVWLLGVKAFILAQQAEYDQALALIDDVLAQDSGSLWDLDLKALCHERLGEQAEARAIFQQIWTGDCSTATQLPEQKRILAWAAYKLGQPDAAIAILRELLAEDEQQGTTMRNLGLCYFASGDFVRAEETILRGLVRANGRELDEFIRELADLQTTYPRACLMPGGAVAATTLERAAVALLAQRRSPGEDLRTVAEKDRGAAAAREMTLLLQSVRPGGEGWIETGIRAALARLELEGGRWQEAARSYRELRQARPDFVEADRGIDHAVDGLRDRAEDLMSARDHAAAAKTYRELLELRDAPSWNENAPMARRALADALWYEGRDAEALEEYERALAASRPTAQLGPLHARIALLHQYCERFEAAQQSIERALEWFRDSGASSPGEMLAESLRPLIRDIAHFWIVDQHWADLERQAAPGLAADLAAARRSLLPAVGLMFGLDALPDPKLMVPVIPEIALEVGSALVPLVDPQLDSARFIPEEIPAMRLRIETSMGVRLPGIRVRADAGTAAAYTVLLHGVPVSHAAVRLGERYCLASRNELRALGLADDMEEAASPVSGQLGCWCPPRYWPALLAAGFTVLTETAFILRHFEAVLRRNLDRFVGLDEIFPPGIDGRLTEPANSMLKDVRDQYPVVQVLRELLREGVAIVDWTSAVNGIAAGQAISIEDMVHEIRDRLRGAHPSAGHLPVADILTDVGAERRRTDRHDGR